MRNYSKALCVSLKPADAISFLVKNLFSQVSERRMADVVSEARGFDGIWIDATQSAGQIGLLLVELFGQPSTNLGDLKTVCEAGVEKKSSGTGGYLGDTEKPLEGRRIQHNVPVFLKECPIITLSGSGIFMEPCFEALC